MTLHQLKVFAKVAAEGSFSQAAKKLFISQPSVSYQVRELEREVKAELFEQTGRRVHLTQPGETLFGYARQDLARVPEERLARLGQVDPTPGLLEQLGLDLSLELPHLVGDRRLGDKQLLGRLGEAPLGGHLGEDLELVQGHIRLLYGSNRNYVLDTIPLGLLA